MEQRPIGTVLIGVNALLREGLALILDGADFEILASASHLDASIATSLPHHQTALLIIEATSDTDSTIRQIESFKERCPAGRVVVLAHQLQLPEMVLAFTAGANAYLVSVAKSDVFIKSLELVMLGETILPHALLNQLYTNENTSDGGNDKLDHQDAGKQEPEDYRKNGKDDPSDDSNDNDSDEDLEAIEGALPRMRDNGRTRLSARQRLILRYLIEGDPNKTIARKIHITEATVKVHVKAILRKIRVHNRTQAAIWAINNGSFIPKKDDASSAAPNLSNQPCPGLAAEQIAPPEPNGALPSSLEFKMGGAHNGTGGGDDHVVQSSLDRNYD